LVWLATQSRQTEPSKNIFKRRRSRFLDYRAVVFDFWVAVHDDMGTAAAFSAHLRFQSSDRRLTLNRQKVKAAPLADRLIAHGATHVDVSRRKPAL